MKILRTAFLLFFFTQAFGQEDYKVPRLRKVAIGNSGTYAYMPSENIEVDLSYSEDSSEVYTTEYDDGNYHFSIIVVKLKSTLLESPEDKTNLLESYLDFLQTQFEVTSAAGYGEGHTMESEPDAIGVLDYWVDKDDDHWEVKGWANSNTLGIMMIYGANDYPIFNVQQMYLDGFRFH